MAITTNFSSEILALVTDITSAETADISNAIYESVFEIGKLAETHTVIEGVREGNVVPILSNSPNYASFPYKDPSNCTIPACDLDLPFDAKVWQIGMIACKIPICVNTFDDNFLAFFKEYKRVFNDNDLNSALMQYIITRFQNNLEAALWRVTWFGERATASGNANYALLRPIDGIFVQAEAMDGIKIPITQNNSGTAGAPVALTGEQVYNYINAAYQRISLEPWFGNVDLQLEMTSAMAAVWVAWLNSLGDRSQYNCECYDPNSLVAMRSFTIDGNLRAFGIPVIVRREFDGVITQLGLGFPYRALLTAKGNILFGTSETDQINQFEIWYSKDDGMIYLRGGSSIAASLVTSEYVYLGAETA